LAKIKRSDSLRKEPLKEYFYEGEMAMNRFLPKSEIATVINVDEDDKSSMLNMEWSGSTVSKENYWPVIKINFAKIARAFNFESSIISDNLIRLYVMGSIYHETKKSLIEGNLNLVDTDMEIRLWLRNTGIVQSDFCLYQDYAAEAIESLLGSEVEFSAEDWLKFLLNEIFGTLTVKKNVIESQRRLKCFMCGKLLREEVEREPEKFLELVVKVGTDPLASLIIFCSPKCRDLGCNLKETLG